MSFGSWWYSIPGVVTILLRLGFAGLWVYAWLLLRKADREGMMIPARNLLGNGIGVVLTAWTLGAFLGPLFALVFRTSLSVNGGAMVAYVFSGTFYAMLNLIGMAMILFGFRCWLRAALDASGRVNGDNAGAVSAVPRPLRRWWRAGLPSAGHLDEEGER